MKAEIESLPVFVCSYCLLESFFIVFLNIKAKKVNNDTISKEHENTYSNSRSASSSALEDPYISTSQLEKAFGGWKNMSGLFPQIYAKINVARVIHTPVSVFFMPFLILLQPFRKQVARSLGLLFALCL